MSKPSREAPNLDAEIEALRGEVEAGNDGAVQRRLERIETLLDGLDNVLVRGFAYAEVKDALGAPQEAATVLEDLLAVIGDHPVAFFQLGCYRRRAGEAQPALQAFAAAVQVDPGHLGSWLALGTLLDERAEPEAAIEAYRQALRIAPSNVDVWRNLGNALAALGRFDEALSAYETGLGLQPGERTLVLLRAAVYQAQGDVDRANALTPPAIAREVGEVVEVRVDGLGCRFRCGVGVRAELERRAAQWLHSLRSTVARRVATGWSRTPAGVYVVERGALALACDPDPTRTGRPHRFFDASVSVMALLGSA